MNLIVWFLVGGLTGWASSVFLGAENRRMIVLDIVVGVVGAAIGGLLLSSLESSSGKAEYFSVTAMIVSFQGAVILLGIVKVVQRA